MKSLCLAATVAVHDFRSRRLSSRSIAARMRSSRVSPSSRQESIRATVSEASGRVSRLGQSFLRPITVFSYVRY